MDFLKPQLVSEYWKSGKKKTKPVEGFITKPVSIEIPKPVDFQRDYIVKAGLERYFRAFTARGRFNILSSQAVES